ncbi:MAG TPA: hypothetical protein VGK20_00585 [Candidatus Binatia bacterium]|jgi:hypothetical protein
MKHTFYRLVGAVAVASLVGAAGIAQADTAADIACHSAIGKNVSKLQATLVKNMVGCHKARDKGGLNSTDCNKVIGTNSADIESGGKNSAAISAAVAAMTAVCTDANAAVIALYPNCPSPESHANTTMDNVLQCLTKLSADYVGKLGATVLGNPQTEPLSKAEGGCKGAVAKALSKAIKTDSGTRAKCMSSLEKTNGALVTYGSSTCIDGAGDPKGKIAGAITAVDTGIDGKCGAASLLTKSNFQDMDFCSGTLGSAGNNAATAVGLHTCITKRAVAPTADGLAALIFELPGKCAVAADVIINAGFGQKHSNTRLDTGFTGLGQDVDVEDNSLGGVKLSGCNAFCEDCQVRIDSHNGYCRCGNSPTTKCFNNIETADATECPGGGDNVCHCMFGPPLALNAGGTPACVVNTFSGDFTGTTQAVGEYNVTTRTNAIVYTGESLFAPCPTCSGAGTPTVGGTGTCHGGQQTGAACHIDAIHPDFGPVSFDCQPSSGKNVSGTGLKLALAFTSGDSPSVNATINNASFCDTSAGPCHCSVCTGNTNVACNSTADCTAFGAGTCGFDVTTLSGVDQKPKQNQCGTVCMANTSPDDGMGTCDDPIDNYCDGASILRASGRGILTCFTNADCTPAHHSDCPGGDCGNCTLQLPRSCFLPAVTATGTPGIYNSEGVSAFCTGPTSNSGINDAGGVPGPGRVKLDFDFNVWCDAAHTKQFQLPGGSNCP